MAIKKGKKKEKDTTKNKTLNKKRGAEIFLLFCFYCVFVLHLVPPPLLPANGKKMGQII